MTEDTAPALSELAERLFTAEHPPGMRNFPYGHRLRLSDLWPCYRERYFRMAEEILRVKP